MVKVAHPMGIYTHNKKGQPFVTNFKHLHCVDIPSHIPTQVYNKTWDIEVARSSSHVAQTQKKTLLKLERYKRTLEGHERKNEVCLQHRHVKIWLAGVQVEV